MTLPSVYTCITSAIYVSASCYLAYLIHFVFQSINATLFRIYGKPLQLENEKLRISNEEFDQENEKLFILNEHLRSEIERLQLQIMHMEKSYLQVQFKHAKLQLKHAINMKKEASEDTCLICYDKNTVMPPNPCASCPICMCQPIAERGKHGKSKYRVKVTFTANR